MLLSYDLEYSCSSFCRTMNVSFFPWSDVEIFLGTRATKEKIWPSEFPGAPYEVPFGMHGQRGRTTFKQDSCWKNICTS